MVSGHGTTRRRSHTRKTSKHTKLKNPPKIDSFFTTSGSQTKRMSASCIAYCFDTFTTHCQSLDENDLKEFLCDTIGYKRFQPRELYQDYQWLLDEGALAEWLVDFLNDHIGDHDAVNALVEGAFECPTLETRRILYKQCLVWLATFEPAKRIRAAHTKGGRNLFENAAPE